MSADRPAWVYEIWAGEDCLYIGCTVNLRSRLSDHARYLYGWQDVTEVRVRDFPTQGKALAAEAALIYAMRPSLNVRHHPEHDQSLRSVPRRAEVFERRLREGLPSSRRYAFPRVMPAA